MTFELIIAALNAGMRLVDLATKAGENAKQNREWTPEEEIAFTNKLEDLKSRPYWKPEAE